MYPNLLSCFVTTKQHHPLQRWLGLAQYVVRIINIELGFNSASFRISHHLPLPSFLSCTEWVALSVAIAVLSLYIFGTWCSGKSKSVTCTFLIWPCFYEKKCMPSLLSWVTLGIVTQEAFSFFQIRKLSSLCVGTLGKSCVSAPLPSWGHDMYMLPWISQVFFPFCVSVLFSGVKFKAKPIFYLFFQLFRGALSTLLLLLLHTDTTFVS